MGEPDLDDAQAEALLQGRSPADPDLAPVAAFLGDLRHNAARPAPPPSPALAALLRKGSAVAAPVRPSPNRRPDAWLRGWRRWVAVGGIGTSVLLTSVVGAGAAGLLPGPAERVVEETVASLTPLELPKPRAQARARERERARTDVARTPTTVRPAGEPAPSTTAPPTTVPDQARPGVTSTTSVANVTTPPVTGGPASTTTTAPATTTTVPGLPRLPFPTSIPTVTLPTIPIPPVTVPRFRW